ncbi:hypothetical protein [Sphingosinicella sp. LY1275]|uniref:hypothetical protein n=1 Tax=Sphingosinicella sp. LY1275 TaxID=3095379 RepID=UPI002ADEBA91|nr:hypothetical protein [Sphingosinicella sp. LY1275]MEA1015605.1 hypothetical protein [Sphingosinicella sp. LY1275]
MSDIVIRRGNKTMADWIFRSRRALPTGMRHDRTFWTEIEPPESGPWSVAAMLASEIETDQTTPF